MAFPSRRPTSKRTAQRPKSLIQKAKEQSNKYRRKKSCWFDEYSRSHPEHAQELKLLVQDWINHGEARQALPKLSSLHRFCLDNCEGIIDIRYATFRIWINLIGG